MDDGSQLKSLDIVGSVSGVSLVDWTSLSPELLAQVLVSLEGGSFWLTMDRGTSYGQTYKLTVARNKWSMCSLTPAHVTSLFTKIAHSSVMNVKILQLVYLGSQGIEHIAPELLSQAVTKLKMFHAYEGGLGILTAAQISAVFTRLSLSEDHKLKILPSLKTTSVQCPLISWWRGYLAWRRWTCLVLD